MRLRRKVFLRVIALAAVAAGLACWRPVSWLSLGTLEWWYRPDSAPEHENVGAIVVLSGGDVRARYEHAAWIFRHLHVPVLASVGRGNSPAAAAHCADLARRILRAGGVPASMIWIEARSANTYEDAKYTAEVLSRKRVRSVVLVTEAYHTLRADMSFRKQGLHVVPAPCAYRAARLAAAPWELIPRQKFIRENRDAVREWIGIAWYFVNGYL